MSDELTMPEPNTLDPNYGSLFRTQSLAAALVDALRERDTIAHGEPILSQVAPSADLAIVS